MQDAVHMMRLACLCIAQVYPLKGNTAPYYLFDYGNTENITYLLVEMS